jgi:sulfur relay (sulfurtransferase) DsrF/TusC family protein
LSMETTFIFRSMVAPGSRFWEGLRLSAAFVGMDHIPLIVFMDDAVPGLVHNALPLRQLWDYLKTTSDLAGIYVLDSDMDGRGMRLEDLDPNLNVKMITLEELGERLADSRVVAIF